MDRANPLRFTFDTATSRQNLDNSRFIERSPVTEGSLARSTTKSATHMKIESLHILFAEELKDLYDAEKRLVKALPKMAKAAVSTDLRGSLQDHLEQTKTQVMRLEEIFGLLEMKPKARSCSGIKGILEEGDETVAEAKGGPANDVVIVYACRKVEHYEIASYRSLHSLALAIGQTDAAGLIQETLSEEEAADETLAGLSEQLLHAGLDDSETRPMLKRGSKAPAKKAGKR